MASFIITVVFVRVDVLRTGVENIGYPAVASMRHIPLIAVVDSTGSGPVTTTPGGEQPRYTVVLAFGCGSTIVQDGNIFPAPTTVTPVGRASPHTQNRSRFLSGIVVIVSAIVGAITMFMVLAYS
ncbi:hypothetical protein C8R42DRAFT_729799 [Lentinula raphanica]|nr:hypothetical protein C8R42DRAFT_729799 [Lentinula raphanica]